MIPPDSRAACREVIGQWSKLLDLYNFATQRHGYCNSDCGTGICYPEDLDDYQIHVERIHIPMRWVQVYAFQSALPPGYELLVPEHTYLEVLAHALEENLHLEQAAKINQLAQSEKIQFNWASND